ncbi:MAG: hypothetical protein V7K90_10490 [Nostoc sp.]|uniref:VWA domain-containing protein n=1 Tax=Nostoc sp. TaxID=1180 RepID=UPI002FF9134E
MNDPALLELFTCLRKAGLPLGLAEYHLLLESINAGFGTSDRTALAQLCCALWVKSQREEEIFQDYFNQIIPERLEQDFFESKTEDTTSTTNQKEQPIFKRRKTTRIPRLLILGLATCVVTIGSAFFLKELIFPKENESLAGSLSFVGGIPFITPKFIAQETEKIANIKISRTGGSHGTVSATLIIEKNIQKSDILDDTPQVIQFKNGEAGEKTIRIRIFNNDKVETNQRATLRLTDPQGGVKLGNHSVADLTIQDDDGIQAIFALSLWLFIPICMIFLLVVWKMRKIQQTVSFADDAIIPETYTNLPKTMLSPEVMRTMADEIQVARAIRQSDNQLSEFPLIVNDLPVTHRQMKQGWRYLRQFSREGPPIELDMEATIQQVAQYGVLLNPVLVPRRSNRIELLLLIDQDGSMVPFHHLSQELADTALRGGRFSRVRIYYFHNCPDEYLYRDRYHLEAESIDDCLSKLPKTRTVCLIFSDAGAARGGLSSRRRRLTKFFLKELRQYVRYTTWLNPVPRHRWETTTAHDIAALVPMFEVNRQEFYRAINVLRGRHQPLGEVS